MRIIDLLEDRRDFLRNRYLPLIARKLDQLRIPDGIRSQIRWVPGDMIADQIFAWLESRDPTRNKAYLQWILGCAIDRRVPFEDLEYLPDALGQYDELKRTNQLPIEARDINRIRTPSELDALLAGHQRANAEASEEELRSALGQSRVVYSDDNWLVVIPGSAKAAQVWGRGTQWCTAWGDPKGLHPKRSCQYADYAQSGPLVVVINRQNPDERYQLQDRSGQYMDRNDRTIHSPGLLIRRWPRAMVEAMVRYVPLWLIRSLDRPSENLLVAAVSYNGNIIAHIKDPSEAVQLAAVRQTASALAHIVTSLRGNPSEAVQLAAVRKNGIAIQHIKDPSEAVQLAAVEQRPAALAQIRNPTPSVIELARTKGYDREGRKIGT